MFRNSCRNNAIIFGCCMKIFQNVFDIVIIRNKKSMPVAPRSNSWARGRSLAGIAVSNPAMRYVSVCCDCCVSGRSLCDELITCPGEPYRQWCVVVCDLKTTKIAMARFGPKR